MKENITRVQDFFNVIQPNQNTQWMLKMNGHPWPQISFFFSFWLSCGLWDLSSPTRDWTQAMAVKARVLTTRPSGNSPKFQIFVFLKLFIICWLFSYMFTFFLSCAKIHITKIYHFNHFSVCDLVTLSIFSLLCNQPLELFHFATDTLVPLNNNSIPWQPPCFLFLWAWLLWISH